MIRLLDGQTIDVTHTATTIAEFIRYLRKEKFIIAGTGVEEIGVSARSVATVRSPRRRAEEVEPSASGSHDKKVATG